MPSVFPNFSKNEIISRAKLNRTGRLIQRESTKRKHGISRETSSVNPHQALVNDDEAVVNIYTVYMYNMYIVAFSYLDA